MDYKRIEDLLYKYFEANTSIAEENELKAFFNSNENIPENLLYAKKLFAVFTEEKQVILSKEIITQKTSKRKLFIYISGIAASIVIAVFIMFINTPKNEIIYAYINGKAITNKVVAEQYTRQALLAVSKNLDNGTKNLNKLSEFNKLELLIKTKK